MNLFLYFSSLLLGSLGAFTLKIYAQKWGFVDRPNERSSHFVPTPKGGGIGILAAFVFSSLFLKISYEFWVPAAFLSLLSFWSDRLDLSPKIRLPIQFIAALSLAHFSGASFQTSAWLFSVLIVFIVGTANFYNFMDGINGIAALTGTIAFCFLAFFGFRNRTEDAIAVLSVCIAFACLGFLPFNIPKARLFMGDVGSILLGLAFATTAVRLSRNFLDFVCLAGFLFPFYADELVTMAIRIKSRENLLKPHRRHFYQILANEMRIPHWKISAGYGLMQIIIAALLLTARPSGYTPVLIILAVFIAVFILANTAIRRKYKC